MKNLITLLFLALCVSAQAQRGWSPESFAKMQEGARIVGQPTDNASIQKYLDEAMQKCFTFPTNDKQGNIPARKVNIWLPKGRLDGSFLAPWNYIVTVDLVWGNVPSEIKHPNFPDKILVTGNYLVPQSELIKAGRVTHKFFRPTFAQYKKMTTDQQRFVDAGGLVIGKITKAELNKLKSQ